MSAIVMLDPEALKMPPAWPSSATFADTVLSAIVIVLYRLAMPPPRPPMVVFCNMTLFVIVNIPWLKMPPPSPATAMFSETVLFTTASVPSLWTPAPPTKQYRPQVISMWFLEIVLSVIVKRALVPNAAAKLIVRHRASSASASLVQKAAPPFEVAAGDRKAPELCRYIRCR